jgi:sigma-B regulation protein RsbU (phosphoserine phosphatase)
VSYLRSLGDLSGTAIARSHTIDELQQVNRQLDRKIHELNTLFEIGKEFSAVLDPEALVKMLVFTLMGQIGVNRHLVALREGADMRIVASRVDGDPPQGEFLLPLLRLRTATVVEEMVVRSEPDPRPHLAKLGLALAVPMLVQGEPKGLLLLGEKMNRARFLPDDLEFISSIGNSAIIALENARLFREAIEKQKMEDELKIAREIQKGLLPSILPEIPGVRIAATNVSSKQVGGDYYDVLALPGGRFVIAIGDVSGKGTPAALLMANLQATIRALVPLELGLAELTARVNDLLCQNTGGSRFVTFFWGIIDPAARTLTYVNAGHNYPYVLRADGTMERLDRGGMILGVMPGYPAYEEATLAVRCGDLLVLFTDGVSEAMSADGVEYGEPRLEEVIRGVGDIEPAAVIAAVQDDVLTHTRTAPQSDDITMMVVRFF